MATWEDYQKTLNPKYDLWSAAKDGRVDVLKTFLEMGSDLNQLDARGYSALMLAAYSGQKMAAEFLIAYGADVNSADLSGNTVLMGCCFK